MSITFKTREAEAKPKPTRIQIGGCPYDCDALRVSEVLALRNLDGLGQCDQLMKVTEILAAALNRADSPLTADELREISTPAEIKFLADLMIRVSFMPNAVPAWNREPA